MAQAKGKKQATGEKKQPSVLVKTYLILYNVVQTLGWSYLLYQLLEYYIKGDSSISLYEKTKWTILIFQNAALLEVVHAALRLVSSNPLVTAMQVASRIFVVNGALILTTAPRESIGLPLALLAWSITEVIRYGNYACTLLNCVPYIVQWLRYSTFIILYPIGVSGELLCLYATQNEVAQTKLLTIEMPNPLNFIFNYQHFILFVMFLYLPLFPQLFMHMVTQRKKVLGRTKKE